MRPRWLSIASVPMALVLGLSAGCAPRGESHPGLLLSGAFFEGGKPVPARLILARPGSGEEGWSTEALQTDDGSIVFHKAMYFEPVVGEPGILTVAGSKSPTPAYVKLWRKKANGWEGEILYQGQYGGDFDRCRDVEVADVTGDGVDDIVVVTHQRGVVVVIEQKDGGYVPTEIGGTVGTDEPVWIHEVETGDVDGDGKIEFMATPSAPNNLEGEEQPGHIVMYRYQDGEYQETMVEEFTTRHVKEILCSDFFGTGTPALFASVEGESIGSAGGASTLIRLYRWKDGKLVGEDVMSLPGKLCRFLATGDTDGDGNLELIASTAKDGIYSIDRDGDQWRKRSVADSSLSRGFEHAACVIDWDGDGRDEVFAVSDDHKLLRRFYYDADTQRFQTEKLLEFDNDLFIFSIEPLPAGH